MATSCKPVSSYQELLDEIEGILAAAPGARLVFRGQTKRHDGGIIPSIMRPGSSAARQNDDQQWRRFIFWHTMSGALDYARAKGKDNLSAGWTATGYNLHTHLDAMLQHYGARSSFVDVTKSLDVALWFAHHQFNLDKIVFNGKNARGAEHNPDVELTADWAHYSDRTEEHDSEGYLFVFAVAEPQNKGALAHGDFVDLAWLRTSARMVAQQAGLIYVDPRHGVPLQPAAAFAFDVPLRGAPRDVPRTDAEKLFPPPRIDPQYRELLDALPFVTNPADVRTLCRPMAIPEYRNRRPRSAHDQNWRSFRERDRALIPTFLAEVAPELDSQGLLPLTCRLGGRAFSLGDAERVLSRVLSSELETSSSDLAAPIEVPPQLHAEGLNFFLEYPVVQSLIPELNQRYALAFLDEADNTIALRIFVELPNIRGVWVAAHGNEWQCQLFGFADNMLEPHPGFVFAGSTPGTLAVLRPRPGNKDAEYLCSASLAALQHVLAIFRHIANGQKLLLPALGPLFQFYLDSTTHKAWTTNWALW